MQMITLRRPGRFDTTDMAALLNDIIRAGGTTAMTRPMSASDIAAWMAFDPDASAWHVAVDGREKVLGFQVIHPDPSLPPDAAEIATFVQIGQTGFGIGSRLFDATRAAARALGYNWINATIRADNDGGLIYYQSRGFEDYGAIRDCRLSNGETVDKTLKRFML